MKKRVSVYIDGANFSYGIKTLNERYTDFMFDFEKLINFIVGNNVLAKAYYYNSSLKRKLNPDKWQRQQELFNRLRKIKGFEVVLCRRQKRLSKSDEEYYTIKGDDIHLAIDMLNDACENKYDSAILVSGDGDFSHLLRYVKRKEKEVLVVSFAGVLSGSLTKHNQFKIIDRKLANKCFWRGNKTKQ